MQKFKKPVVLVAWQKAVAQTFRKYGIAVYDDELQAMRLLALITDYAARQKQPLADWAVQAATAPAAVSQTRTLSEKDSLHQLQQAGLPIVAYHFVQDKNEAVQALQELGAPCVLKACSEQLPHKSEYGLVALNLETSQAMETAFAQQEAILKQHGIAAEGWIVARQEKGLHEATIGAYVDEIFGPIVVVGSGGKYVEALPDVAILMPPFSVEEVEAALQELRLGVLLAGVRGEPAADTRALAEMAVQVGKFIVQRQDTIHSLDINPVLVKENDVVAVDGLIETVP